MNNATFRWRREGDVWFVEKRGTRLAWDHISTIRDWDEESGRQKCEEIIEQAARIKNATAYYDTNGIVLKEVRT